MSDEKLKPCPFCGGDAETETTVLHFTVRCIYCPAEIQSDSKFKEFTINNWNKRVEPEKTLSIIKKDISNLSKDGFLSSANVHLYLKDNK